MEQNRSSFTGKLGFVMAAAGSAVGLGNIWRFPYLAAEYGGGIFLLVYLILAVTFGFALLVAETAIGRKTGLSAIGAFKSLHSKYSFIGYIESIVPVIIFPYYCVIGGWVSKYMYEFIAGNAKIIAQNDFFQAFITQSASPLGWFAVFLGITSIIVWLGVEKGIEKISKWIMPVLILLSIFVSVYSMFLPGALEGIKYYLIPDFDRFSFMTVVSAMGQLFYSMSLGMAIMITYGSYMKKDVNLEASVRQIELFDTGIAFLAGLMIIPAVFAFSGGDHDALGKGPGLMFITLPQVFASMQGGGVVGAVFFVLVFFAALTSSISLMEAIVSIVQDRLKVKRGIAILILLVIALVLGIPSSLGNGVWSHIKLLGMDFLTFFDFISNSMLMPVVGFLTCIFVGYVIKPSSVIEEVELTGRFKSKKLFAVVIKYIAPICIILILGFSILEALGVIVV